MKRLWIAAASIALCPLLLGIAPTSADGSSTVSGKVSAIQVLKDGRVQVTLRVPGLYYSAILTKAMAKKIAMCSTMAATGPHENAAVIATSINVFAPPDAECAAQERSFQNTIADAEQNSTPFVGKWEVRTPANWQQIIFGQNHVANREPSLTYSNYVNGRIAGGASEYIRWPKDGVVTIPTAAGPMRFTLDGRDVLVMSLAGHVFRFRRVSQLHTI